MTAALLVTLLLAGLFLLCAIAVARRFDQSVSRDDGVGR